MFLQLNLMTEISRQNVVVPFRVVKIRDEENLKQVWNLGMNGVINEPDKILSISYSPKNYDMV